MSEAGKQVRRMVTRKLWTKYLLELEATYPRLIPKPRREIPTKQWSQEAKRVFKKTGY